MKRILGLVASQRKTANGEILTQEVAKAAGEDCKLELIRLADLNLKLCKACYACLIPGKPCVHNDDLNFLMDKIKAADGIIISVPDYVLGPAGIIKVLADRMIALTQNLDDLWGKPCVLISTYGIQGWEGYTLSALNSIARFMGFEVKDSHLFFGALPGEGIIADGALQRAREMGQALFGKGRSALNGECPTCWSEVWKFPQPGKAVCPICGQTADLVAGEEGIQWIFGEAGKRFEKEYLKEHFQNWLREKVNEFVARRKELAIVRNPYKEGNWLVPLQPENK